MDGADASVAIVIPAYNAAKYAAATIESALRQTRAAAQVIVVDDGSTDDTARIALGYGDAVAYIRQGNAGVSAARNTGAASANAGWLLFLDADDLLLPDALARLTTRGQDPLVGIAYGQCVYFTEETGTRRVHGAAGAEGRVPSGANANFWKSVMATPGAAIIRREVFQAVGGFRPQFDTAADRDFWIRAGTLTEYGFVKAAVIEKREHGSNMSADRNRARQQAAEVQLEVLRWSVTQGAGQFPFGEREVLERNLERSLAERSWGAAAWLCAEAVRRGHEGPCFTRAGRLLKMPVLARKIELRVRKLLRF